MRAVGWITSAIAGGIAALVVFIGARSIPDIKRYLKMRGM
jgi:hypothetical protein